MRLALVAPVGLVVLIGLALLAGAPATGQAYERRDVTVRDLRVRTGDVLAVALHPSTTPIELSARGLDLEACPGTWEAGAADADAGSSWPTADGFTACLPFSDGRVTLPSAAAGGGSMHLVFAVRALANSKKPGTLTISYEPVDGFFIVTPPRVAAGARSPSIVLDAPDRRIAAGPYVEDRDPQVEPLREVAVVVRQRGRVVPGPDTDDQLSVWPTYGPVRPGVPVTIRARNTGAEALRFGIGVDVR